MGQSQFIITGEVEGLPVAYAEELAGTNVGQYVTDVEYIVYCRKVKSYLVNMKVY